MTYNENFFMTVGIGAGFMICLILLANDLQLAIGFCMLAWGIAIGVFLWKGLPTKADRANS